MSEIQLLTRGLDPRLCELRISDLGTCLHINRIYPVVKGGGRKALAQICKNADERGVVLTLNACSVRTPLYPKLWFDDKLVEWYQGFGFQEWHSDNAHFTYMSRLMKRMPRRDGTYVEKSHPS